jgi:hypothetical protein
LLFVLPAGLAGRRAFVLPRFFDAALDFPATIASADCRR